MLKPCNIYLRQLTQQSEEIKVPLKIEQTDPDYQNLVYFPTLRCENQAV
jgi:hypothetical protein